MNDMFDIRRFAAFALSCYKELGVKKLSLYWGLLFLLMCIPFSGFNQDAIREECISNNSEHLVDLLGTYTGSWVEGYRTLLFLIVFFSTLSYSWKFFGNIKLKTTWLLPVSKFEKLSFIALNALVVNVVILTILSYGAISVISSYEYVALQNMSKVSIEEIQEYGDDIELIEHRGITYRKVYPEVRFVDFFIASAPVIYRKTITDKEVSCTSHNDGTTDKYSVQWNSHGRETLTNYDITTNQWFLLFFMFTIALWIGVSPFNKSRNLAFFLHIIGGIVFLLIMPSDGRLDFGNYSELNLFNETGGVFELFIASKIYYLFPFIYLWLSWRKIETMQIKQGIGVMKIYDLLLPGVYAIALMLIVIGGKSYSSQKQNVSDYFRELQDEPIKVVVIENTSMNLRLVKREHSYVDSYSPDHSIKVGIISLSSGGSSSESNLEHLEFKLRGDLSLSSASAFRIEQDTLFIGEANTGERGLELHLCKHIEVDTLNAPNVTIVNK